jgi:hypothetical protein
MKQSMIWLLGALLLAACVAVLLSWGMVRGWW